MKNGRKYLVKVPLGPTQLGALFEPVNGNGSYETTFRRLKEQVFVEMTHEDYMRLEHARIEIANGTKGGFQRRAIKILDGDTDEDLFS